MCLDTPFAPITEQELTSDNVYVVTYPEVNIITEAPPCKNPKQAQCPVEGCGRALYARGICRTHYRRLQTGGDINAEIPIDDVRTKTGRKGEYAIAQILRAHGRTVKMQGQHCPFDLLVDRIHRIEVKTSRARKIKGIPTWCFNIHRHGKLSERCDFYVLRLEGIPYCKYAVHLLLPAPVGRPTIAISFRSLVSGSSAIGVTNFRLLTHGQLPDKSCEVAA